MFEPCLLGGGDECGSIVGVLGSSEMALLFLGTESLALGEQQLLWQWVNGFGG